MSNINLEILFQSIDATSAVDNSIWINMEQGNLPLYEGNVSLYDILHMTARARAQETAFSYRMNDGVYFSDEGRVINIPLTFYLFPSSLSLPYSLSFEGGTLSDVSALSLPITRNVIVPMSNSIEFPALLGSATNFEWVTECYNSMGQIVSPPSYTIEGNKILLSEEVFGVFRGVFEYVGYKYTATLSFKKHLTEEEVLESRYPDIAALAVLMSVQNTQNSITDIHSIVICTYVDEDGESQQEILELKLPQSVEMYLSDCPVGGGGVYPTKVNWPDEKRGCHTVYYYSMCDGEVMQIDHIGYCS